MKRYDNLAVGTLGEFVFGKAPKPVTAGHGLVIGGGTTYPELNFTLPPMTIDATTMNEAKGHYAQIIEEACGRGVELGVPGMVIEFETLPPMTLTPEWSAEVTSILRETLDRYHAKHGLRSALRVTPNDTREHERPPRLRSGELWDGMMRAFELCAQNGADLLSIESTGGKEVSDPSILNADLLGTVFALGILGARDMEYLWGNIVAIADANGSIAAGDTACGFGNTAMVLAEKKYIPRVWGAVVRVLTVPRTLVGYRVGAKGPSKDCAYEGPFMKAIAGVPISMEGAQAACAHLSPVGNVAACVCDLWSNESVQNIKLLGGMAPTVSVEQLAYACRLMNTAAGHGPESALLLRDWMAESDAGLDPHAYILRPDNVLEISSRIASMPTPFLQTREAAFAALDTLRKGHETGECKLPPQELKWLDILASQAEGLVEDEDEFIATALDTVDTTTFIKSEYGL